MAGWNSDVTVACHTPCFHLGRPKGHPHSRLPRHFFQGFPLQVLYLQPPRSFATNSTRRAGGRVMISEPCGKEKSADELGVT